MRTLDLKSDKRIRTFAVAAIIAAWCMLSVLSFAPLRLGTDSIRLFQMALPAACGGAYGVDQFPPFYPHLLCFLMKCGWCNGAILIFINFLALAAGLCVLYAINKRCGIPSWVNLAVVIATMFNWNIAKHAMLPLTDILLLPFFWSTVWALLRYRDASCVLHKVFWIFLAIALAGISVSIRIAAVALFGLIAVILTGLTRKNVRILLARKFFWLACAGLILVITCGVALSIRYTGFADDGGYYSMFKDFMSKGVTGVASMCYSHLFDLTQLILNVPARFLSDAIRLPLVVATSAIVLFSLVFLLVKNRVEWTLFVIIVGYGLEIFLWPCVDPRFFLPILPFLLLVLLRMIQYVFRNQSCISRVAWCTYLFLGMLAWGKFAYQWTWGDGFYRHTTFAKLSLAYKNALVDVRSVPSDGRSIPLFILKKFDLRYRQNDLKLSEYVTFTADFDE